MFDKSPIKIRATASGLLSWVVAVHGQLESCIFYNRIEECQQVFSPRGEGRRIAMIETVKGDEAARLLLDYAGPRTARGGMAFLRELAGRFSLFPYENISKIIRMSFSGEPGRALRMPAEVVRDHIAKGLGGTCFSLTFLLERVLSSLGFDAYKVMAHMNSGRNIHCLVAVREAGETYLIDPGYALYEVICLPEVTTRVKCPHAVVEVVSSGGAGFELWTTDASGRKWRYAFENRPVSDADFESYWVESFAKPTLNNICLTRMTPQGHIYLRKDFFKFTSREGIEKRKVKHDIERVIEEEFGIGSEFTRTAQDILARRREAT
jgi:arylamine N-acetyltransferase